MVYLYLINYSRAKPDLVTYALDGFLSDSSDRNPLIRALAIRTMTYIPVPTVQQALVDPLRHALKDSDPYVRKTAAICVAKLFAMDRKLVEKEGFVASLRDLLADANSTVVANAVAALMEMCERSDNIALRLNMTITNRLMAALPECSEYAAAPSLLRRRLLTPSHWRRWGQTYIIESLMYLVPDDPKDAELLAERLAIRLQHANSAVVLTTIKVILYLMNYMADNDVIEAMCKRLSAPLSESSLANAGRPCRYCSAQSLCYRPATKSNTSHSATSSLSSNAGLRSSRTRSRSFSASTTIPSSSSSPNSRSSTASPTRATTSRCWQNWLSA